MQPQGQGQPSWMNGAIGAGVAVVAALALAIGYVLVTDDGDDDGDTTAGSGAGDASTTTVENGEPGEVNYRDALLTVDDFPDEEWTEVPAEPPLENDYEDDPACEPMYDLLEGDDEGYERNFDHGDAILFAGHFIDDPSEGEPREMAELTDVISACPEYSYTFGQPVVSVVVNQEVLETDQFGDASVAYSRQFHFTNEDGSESYGATVRVAWERDGLYSSVLYVEDQVTGDEEADYLQTEAEELAEIADSRLEDLLG